MFHIGSRSVGCTAMGNACGGGAEPPKSPAPEERGAPKAVVFDIGTSLTKVGFAGEDKPRVVFPTVLGRIDVQSTSGRMSAAGGADDGYDEPRVLVGDDAMAIRSEVSLDFPVDRGVVQNWDDLLLVVKYGFDEIGVAPTSLPVLVVVPPLMSKDDRARMAMLFFGSLKVPALHFATGAELAMAASGRKTGLAVCSGAAVSYTVPVVNGKIVSSAVKRLEVAGDDLTGLMVRHLRERGAAITAADHNSDLARDIKERLCYVALDFSEEMQRPAREIERPYKRTDGSVVTVGTERFRCPEAMFVPLLLSVQPEGLQTFAVQSVELCDEAVRNELYENVVLAGGNTSFKGFAPRMASEIKSTLEERSSENDEKINYEINVIAPDDRRYSEWAGGAELAAQRKFKKRWISLKAYEKKGPDCVN